MGNRWHSESEQIAYRWHTDSIQIANSWQIDKQIVNKW